MTTLILHGPTTAASSIATLDAFDAMTGVKSTMFHPHYPLYNGTNADGSEKWLPINLALADVLWKRGQLALYTLATYNLATKVIWQAADVLAGKYDPYLIAQAKAVAAWAHPIIFRLDHEMNGPWSPWFLPPADFVAKWRYIVGIFRANGAVNASWNWCPNQLSSAGSNVPYSVDNLPPYYPGDDVVTFTGFDTYNWAAAHNMGWLSWTQIASGGTAGLGDTYGTVAKIAPTKPMIVGEFGCHTAPGNRAAWMTDALLTIPKSYPLIVGISYFSKDDPPAAWSLQTADGSAAAYGASLKAGPYAQVGQYPMPPDLKELRPLTTTTAWGDPVADLNTQVSALQAQNAALSQANGALKAQNASLNNQLNDAQTAASLAQSAAAAALARAQTAESSLSQVRANLQALVQFGTPTNG